MTCQKFSSSTGAQFLVVSQHHSLLQTNHFVLIKTPLDISIMVMATSVNVGRRLSSVPKKEGFHQVEDNEFAYCQRLANQISSAQDLPAMCHGFPAVIDTAKRQSFMKQSSDTELNPIHVPRGMARSRLFRRTSSGGWSGQDSWRGGSS